MKRESQNPLMKLRKDKAILQRLSRFTVFKDCPEFFTYITHRGEVDTDLLIKKYFGKKKILVPKMKGDGICLYELCELENFKSGKFGVREPAVCVPRRNFRKISCALIPGIAFDKKGHRIGFGGGHFDRLLKKMHTTTIGLAYEFQIIDKVSARGYDVPVDFIVTEKRVLDCRKNSKF